LVLASLPIFLLSKIRREQWLGLLGLVILVLPLIFFSLKPYQKARLETFLDPERDPFGAGYNVRQSLIAIGSGGLTGRGLGQGSQSTLQFIPVAHTDFIFAGIAEAAGFFGSSALIIIFALLVFRAVKVGLVSQDRFGRLLSFGFACLWLFSCFINMGMNLGLVPVTGIPLPFVSFGGSSLITNFAIAGILQSIYLRHRKISFR
jgi:rod shape determining protein RodA